MRSFESVLRLRPTNAVNRAGTGSRVCILNPRDLLRAQQGDARPLICVELGAVRPVATGLLRAASQLGAAVGLSMPQWPRGEGPSADAFFRDALAAAEDARLSQPMFLRAGPIALRSTDEEELLRAQEAVFGLVDAGFTEILFEVGWLEPEEAAAAVQAVAAGARERELGIVVTAGDPSPEAVAELAGALCAQGAGADAIALPPGSTADADLAELVRAAAPLVLEAPDPVPDSAVGVRRATLSGLFDDLVLDRLPAELRARIAEWMDSSGAGFARAQGHFRRELAEVDEQILLRIEALAYHRALEALDALGARGSGAEAVRFLAEAAADDAGQ